MEILEQDYKYVPGESFLDFVLANDLAQPGAIIHDSVILNFYGFKDQQLGDKAFFATRSLKILKASEAIKQWMLDHGRYPRIIASGIQILMPDELLAQCMAYSRASIKKAKSGLRLMAGMDRTAQGSSRPDDGRAKQAMKSQLQLVVKSENQNGIE